MGTAMPFSQDTPMHYRAFVVSDWFVYTEGYREAADQLYNNIPNQKQDLYVLPIVFLYRHNIEISIKLAYGLLQSISAIQSAQTLSGHRLIQLWKKIKQPVLQYRYMDKDTCREVENALAAIDKIDPRSTAFRYPISPDNQPVWEGWVPLDLQEYREVATAVSTALESLCLSLRETYLMSS